MLSFLVGIFFWLMRLLFLNQGLLTITSNCSGNGSEIVRFENARDDWIMKCSTELFISLSNATVYLSVIFSVLDFEHIGDAFRAMKSAASYCFLAFSLLIVIYI